MFFGHAGALPVIPPQLLGAELRNSIVKDETNDGTAPPTQPWRNKLNLKPSYTTLGFAGMLSARDSAPTHVAFTQIPVQNGIDSM